MFRVRRPAAALVFSGLAALSGACARPDAAARAAAAPAIAAAPAVPTAEPTKPGPAGPTFDAAVRPILEARCTPCHYPGGKMYDRLPFDQPSVLSSHADGVRRRLKGEDLETFEKWLATLPAPSPGARRP